MGINFGTGGAGGAGAITVQDAHIFTGVDIPTCTTNRDNYFIANPGELVEGVQVVLDPDTGDSQLQERRSGVWVDISPVIQGPAGVDGAGAVDDTAFAVAWDGDTSVAPSKNAVYDKLTTMDTATGNNTSDIADIRSLTGTLDGATNLATFTGTTITDNNNVKGALQELETSLETKESVLPWATSSDPAVDLAVTQAIVDANKGVIVTLTAAGNNQTIAAPTDTSAGKYFTVVNNDTSTDVILVNDQSIQVGDYQEFLWDGSAWVTEFEKTSFVNSLNTGLISGADISINVDTTKFDITSGTGMIIDHASNPLKPVLKPVSWGASTAVAVPTLGTDSFVLIYIDDTGSIVQVSGSNITSQSLRDKILVGVLGLSPTNITTTADISVPVGGDNINVYELFQSIGIINTSGNDYVANGANLNLDKTQGEVFDINKNRLIDSFNPNYVTSAAGSGIGIGTGWRDGLGGHVLDTTTLTPPFTFMPDKYDDNTGGSAGVGPNGVTTSNFWQVMPLFLFPQTNLTVTEYGQQLFPTLIEAENWARTNVEYLKNDKIDTSIFHHAPIVDLGIFRGVLILKQGATSLQDKTQAKIILTDKFGGFVGVSEEADILSDVINFGNGTCNEPLDISVTSNGTVISCSVQKQGGGDFETQILNSKYTVTGGTSVNLTAGTDTVPILNYVYLELSGPNAILSASTVGYPSTDTSTFAEIGQFVVQSAATVQTDGVLRYHTRVNQFSDASGGHLSHINTKLRREANWVSGVAPTTTITTQGAAKDNVHIATTVGIASQLHEHPFPVFNNGDDIYVVNDFTTKYNKITDLNQILTDASGGDLTANNSRFSLVVWGAVADDATEAKMFVNVSTGTYADDNAAINDDGNLAVYTIPDDFKGVGFLIARIVLKYNTSSSGTYTELATKDLRGLTSSIVGGAGGSVGNHNQLGGLQGGTINEYFHLTSAEQGNLAGQDQAVKTTDSPTFGGATINGATLIDGSADAVQLTVQGNATQTSNVFVVENSASTDVFTVDNTGGVNATGNVGAGSISAGSGTITGNFSIDTDTFVVDSGDNHIGIGMTPTITDPKVNIKEVGVIGTEQDVLSINATNPGGLTGDEGVRIVFKHDNASANNVLSGIAGFRDTTDINSADGGLRFYHSANNNTLLESMRIDSSGKVGIGVTTNIGTIKDTTPTSTLQVGDGTNVDEYVSIKAGLNGNARISFENDVGVYNVGVDSNDNFAVYNEVTNRYVIVAEDAGVPKVGVGVSSSPAAGLHVDTNNDGTAIVLERSGGAANRRPFGMFVGGTDDAQLFFYSSSDTTAANAFTNQLMRIDAGGGVLMRQDTAGDTSTILTLHNGSATQTNAGCRIQFYPHQNLAQEGALSRGGGLEVDTAGDNPEFNFYLGDGNGVTATENKVLTLDNSGRLHTKGLALSGTGELTIATGAVTITGAFHTLDTEADAASDTLDTINGGVTGSILILGAENAARVVTVSHNTGNIQLAGGANFVLDNANDTITLVYDGANWREIARSSNH